MSPPGLAAPILSAPPTTLEHMFEATPFAVAMSPVVRVADPPGPRNDSAAKLAMVGVLTPGPVAMDLLTQVQIHRPDDVKRTEYLVAWERAARWVEAQRMKAVVAVAGATATNRDDFAREHVKVALSGQIDIGPGRCRSGPGHDRPAGRGRGGAAPRRAPHAEPVPGRGPPGGDPSRPGAGRAGRRAGGPGTDGGQAGPGRRSGRAYPDRPGGRRGRPSPTAADACAAHAGADDERTLDQRRFDALVKICVAALV